MSKFNEQWIWEEEIKFPEIIRLGISSLHCKLRCLEFLFGLGVKIRVENDHRPISLEEKKRLTKQQLQKEFIEVFGVRIAFVKQGKGTSTNGNAATKVLEEPEKSAKIFGIFLFF